MSSEIEKLLEKLEWSILSPFPCCPICQVLKSTGHHDEDCKLNQALTLLRAKSPAGELTTEVRRVLGSPQAIPARLRTITDYCFELCDLLDASNEQIENLKRTLEKVKVQLCQTCRDGGKDCDRYPLLENNRN